MAGNDIIQSTASMHALSISKDQTSFNLNDTSISQEFLTPGDFAKGTADPRVEFSFPKFKQIQTQILNLKLKYLPNLNSLRISTNIQLYNLYKTSAAKWWTNSNFKILPELQLQNFDQTLCSKSEQKVSFLTKPQLPYLQQIVANKIIISNSYNINKFGVGIFTRQGHINKVY